MNRIVYQISAGICVLVVIALGLSYINPLITENSQPSLVLGPGGPTEIILNAEFPAHPAKMMVYTVVPQNTREDAKKIAKILGITEELKEMDNSYFTNEGKWTFYYGSVSGAFSYHWFERESGRDPIDMPEYLPKEEDAVIIAEQFLKSKGIWEEGAEYRRTICQHGYTLWGANNTKQLVHQTMDVYFGRVFNGYNVAGDRIVVSIGGNGDVIGLFKVWRTYSPDKEYAIISPEEAYQKLIEDSSKFPVSKDVPVSITRVYPGYATLTPSESMDFLKPVYSFDYEAVQEGTPVTGTVFIPAVPELGEA